MSPEPPAKDPLLPDSVRELFAQLLYYAESTKHLPNLSSLRSRTCLCDDPRCVRCVPVKTYYRVLAEARQLLRST